MAELKGRKFNLGKIIFGLGDEGGRVGGQKLGFKSGKKAVVKDGEKADLLAEKNGFQAKSSAGSFPAEKSVQERRGGEGLGEAVKKGGGGFGGVFVVAGNADFQNHSKLII